MRRGLVVFLVINLLVIAFLVKSVFTLITLLFEDAQADAVHKAEIPSLGSEAIDPRPQLIPKIIHQTYINESIPDVWKQAQKSCIELHKDYEYKLWTDALAREFIATEYPWFLEVFDGYTQPIQRADVIRYFVLVHFGGVYIDLDQGCNRRLDPLLAYPAWVRSTVPTGISNDVMGSIPKHPFFLRVIDNLQAYNHDWQLPYVTVMYSTGPLFLSVIWKEYIRWGNVPPEARVRILLPNSYNQEKWSFFASYKGSSWHGSDAKTIFWMGQHWLFLTGLGFFAAGCIGICSWWVYARFITFSMRRGQPRWRKVPSSLRFWRWPLQKNSYELLDRREV